MSIRPSVPDISSVSFFVTFVTFVTFALAILMHGVVCTISRDSLEDSLIPGVRGHLVE
jgi:hypothetical protein